jgi:hypothetical protein
MINNTTLQLKIKQRLNKLDSQDYDNIQPWQMIEAFNKAQLQWCRRQIEGINITKAADEQSTTKVDDLQVILTTKKLDMYTHPLFEDAALPDDYMAFKRVDAYAVKDCCADSQHINVTYLAEEENISILLDDYLKKPSFEWGETFCTLIANRLRIYTAGEFELKDVSFIYYRVPRKIEIAGVLNPYTLQTSTTDVICEFKDDIAEIMIDDAVQILAGDMEATFQYQVAQASSQVNT